MLLDETLPRIMNPTDAAFNYWREHFGDLRLEKVTPDLIAIHRDSLLGAECLGFKHKTTKPRSARRGFRCWRSLQEMSKRHGVLTASLRIRLSDSCSRRRPRKV